LGITVQHDFGNEGQNTKDGETERRKDGKTERQKDRKTDRQAGRQTDRRNRYTNKSIHRNTDGWKGFGQMKEESRERGFLGPIPVAVWRELLSEI
jgi:hypothetical protein